LTDKDLEIDGLSLSLVEEAVDALGTLFPEAFREGRIDFSVLQELLGDYTDHSDEHYGFAWHGKTASRRIAQTPSSGTLRPRESESEAWDKTQNLFVTGDNLEVLKLLQKSYYGRVKMIYIDPPYNTGKEFIYPDKYKDNLDTYLRFTGQVSAEGLKFSPNTETAGRYHTNWLNMMYPRLKLARNLLTDDGLIFISIDDHEMANLKKICDEVFGEESLVAVFVWKSRQNKDNRPEKGASIDHEYVLCYGGRIRGDQRKTSQYTNPDNDPRGDWASANMVGLATPDRRPNLHYDLIDPETGINYGCPKMGWRYDRNTMARLIAEDRIIWPDSPNGRPRRKSFISELGSEYTGSSSFIGQDVYTRDGTAEVTDLFGFRAMDFPKPTALIESLIEQGSESDDIILDFFAGSATTGEAVWRLNARDGKRRRFILVQLPEQCGEETEAHKHGYATIADLGRERLRRTAAKIEAEFPGVVDTGFRTFELSSTSIFEWDPDSERLEQSLLSSVSNVKEDRSTHDVLCEVLLKAGLDLAASVEWSTVGDQQIAVVEDGALVVVQGGATSDDIASSIIDLRDQCQPEVMQVVFLDGVFADDVVKTNVIQALRQGGITEVKCV